MFIDASLTPRFRSLLSLHMGKTSRGNGRCLDNEALPAPGLDFQSVSRLPGEQYSPDLQCQLALGTQYKAYYSAKQPFNVSQAD